MFASHFSPNKLNRQTKWFHGNAGKYMSPRQALEKANSRFNNIDSLKTKSKTKTINFILTCKAGLFNVLEERLLQEMDRQRVHCSTLFYTKEETLQHTQYRYWKYGTDREKIRRSASRYVQYSRPVPHATWVECASQITVQQGKKATRDIFILVRGIIIMLIVIIPPLYHNKQITRARSFVNSRHY